MADATRPTDQPAQSTQDAGHHDAGPDDAVYDDDYRLANGLAGEALTIPSANPTNFHQAISDTAAMPGQDIWAKLFLPDEPGPFPVVIVVPGSLGLQPHHLAHASAIVDTGIAACGLDPFGPRSVTSTVANQVQYSFAASAWDVLAAAEVLAARPDIDATRIGAQGHSRGGSAVLSAASVHLAAASGAPKLAGAYAAYPWSGHQFVDPSVGSTRVRAIIGDQDDWCSPMQVQAHIGAMRVAGGDATVRIVPDAHHSFDRSTPLEHIPDAAVTPGAPTVYIADDGAFIPPTSDEPDPSIVDLDGFLYAINAGYGIRGAHIGGTPELAPLFTEDMLTFWTAVMSPTR
ncbi:dienelactone hydrolase family protein [Candidatus Poriferisodalis sp.]|uniref:dienelactone hydrolase family protein n=1 Tax=Candidatus Poriferisodalis sp. TaxID=3101277 RepID=UPI003B029A52